MGQPHIERAYREGMSKPFIILPTTTVVGHGAACPGQEEEEDFGSPRSRQDKPAIIQSRPDIRFQDLRNADQSPKIPRPNRAESVYVSSSVYGVAADQSEVHTLQMEVVISFACL